MGDRLRSATMEDLPLHLVLEILTSGGRLGGVDLVCLELTNSVFRGGHGHCGLVPNELRSLVDFAAFRVCGSDSVYGGLSFRAREELLSRCGGNWKRVLRFLQSVNQSSDVVETSAGNMQIRSGRYHTLLIKDSIVYSCGSSLSGVLGHGPETTQCVAFTPIQFPNHARVTHVSASHNHAAFVTQSGEVFTCGDNSSFCCGHSDTSRPIFKPRLVEALKEVPCKQVETGVSFTVFLTREGQVYTCGTSAHGQLGHGDTLDRPTPKLVEALVSVGPVVQIAAGPSYALAVTNDGTVYSFGSGTNFCLGHGEQHNELRPRPLQSFRRKGIHIVRVSAGDEHVVALDSNGYVYTWGKGYCGALGHGDEIDKTTPELLSSLKTHLAVQVCASKRKTFVLVDNGCLYGFGWMGFGSLGFPDRGASDKVLKPSMLNSLKGHHISQVSTGLYHSVVVTNRGRIFGFGDNERAQLAHDELRLCVNPTEIFLWSLTLAGYFIGKRPAFPFVQFHAKRMWKQYGLFEVILNDQGYFFFKFNSDKGLNFVFENGPWLFNGMPIFIQKWEPGLCFDKPETKKVPLWVNIYGLPLDVWDLEILSYLASVIGEPISVDRYTEEMCETKSGRAIFARILVNASADYDLPTEIDAIILGKLRKFRTEFLWKPKRCSFCNLFGHDLDSCLARPRPVVDVKTDKPLPSVTCIGETSKAKTMDDGFKFPKRKNNPKPKVGPLKVGSQKPKVAFTTGIKFNQRYVPKANKPSIDPLDKGKAQLDDASISSSKLKIEKNTVKVSNQFSILEKDPSWTLEKKEVDDFVGKKGVGLTPTIINSWSRLKLDYFIERWERVYGKEPDGSLRGFKLPEKGQYSG